VRPRGRLRSSSTGYRTPGRGSSSTASRAASPSPAPRSSLRSANLAGRQACRYIAQEGAAGQLARRKGWRQCRSPTMPRSSSAFIDSLWLEDGLAGNSLAATAAICRRWLVGWRSIALRDGRGRLADLSGEQSPRSPRLDGEPAAGNDAPVLSLGTARRQDPH